MTELEIMQKARELLRKITQNNLNSYKWVRTLRLSAGYLDDAIRLKKLTK